MGLKRQNKLLANTTCVSLMCISQVSLGKSNELLAADYTADKLPADCQSVKGMGRVAPDPKDTCTM